MHIRLLNHNFVRFIITGGVTVVVDYGSLLFMYHILHIRLVMAITASYVLALIVNFLLTKLYTFQSRSGGHKKHIKEAIAYLALVGFNLLFTNFVIIQLEQVSIDPAISKLLTLACITLWDFYLYKTYIFKPVKIN